MEIELRKSAIKDLSKLLPNHRSKVLSAISSLKNFPNIGNVKRLMNFDFAFRLRVGDYRILFDTYNGIIYVARILHRKDAYKH
ncbi:MAG: type II toxin-antitoxin system RelE/ParE family toxin [Bacteroidota bacterium]